MTAEYSLVVLLPMLRKAGAQPCSSFADGAAASDATSASHRGGRHDCSASTGVARHLQGVPALFDNDLLVCQAMLGTY